MNISKNAVVTLKYKVSDELGRLVEEAKEPMAYLHGGYANTLPLIESTLEGKTKGFATTLNLPADAFGLRDESLVQTISRKEFPPGVKVGGQLRGAGTEGHEQAFTVVKIKGDTVHLDGNHPWAGKALKFQLQVTDVRAALPVEIEHKHVHGTGGHNH